MRKIVTRGLYTYMEGMCPRTEFTGNAEMNKPLKQDKNKSLEELFVDGRGNEEGIAQNSRTVPTFYEELGYRLKFTAWQRIISHRKQRRAALLPETHNTQPVSPDGFNHRRFPEILVSGNNRRTQED